MTEYIVKVTFVNGENENFKPTTSNVDEILCEVKEYYKNKEQLIYDKDFDRYTYSYHVITEIEITNKKRYDEYYDNYAKDMMKGLISN